MLQCVGGVSLKTRQWVMATVVLVSCLVGLASAGHALHTSWMQLEELWHAEYKTVEQIRTISQPIAELSDALQRSVECISYEFDEYLEIEA